MLSFRELAVTDIAECQGIWAELGSHYDHPIGGSWNNEKLADEIRDHQGVGIFSGEGQLEAFCLYRLLPPDRREIMLLVTRPRAHRTGAMRALMRSFIDELRPDESVWLEVHAGNVPAISLYESFGFQLCGERPDYYADGGKALLYEYKPLQ